jgi:hypothetical protein
MGSLYQMCQCQGFEFQVYDRIAADGPRRTICVGVLRSRTCYQFRHGPTVACPG